MQPAARARDATRAGDEDLAVGGERDVDAGSGRPRSPGRPGSDVVTIEHASREPVGLARRGRRRPRARARAAPGRHGPPPSSAQRSAARPASPASSSRASLVGTSETSVAPSSHARGATAAASNGGGSMSDGPAVDRAAQQDHQPADVGERHRAQPALRRAWPSAAAGSVRVRDDVAERELDRLRRARRPRRVHDERDVLVRAARRRATGGAPGVRARPPRRAPRREVRARSPARRRSTGIAARRSAGSRGARRRRRRPAAARSRRRSPARRPRRARAAPHGRGGGDALRRDRPHASRGAAAAARASRPKAHDWRRGSRLDSRRRVRGHPLRASGDGIAKITINRPEVRNAFRPQTLVELSDAFERAREDAEVGVIVLTGEGPHAFCSGGDQRVRGDAGYMGDDAGSGIGRLQRARPADPDPPHCPSRWWRWWRATRSAAGTSCTSSAT